MKKFILTTAILIAAVFQIDAITFDDFINQCKSFPGVNVIPIPTETISQLNEAKIDNVEIITIKPAAEDIRNAVAKSLADIALSDDVIVIKDNDNNENNRIYIHTFDDKAEILIVNIAKNECNFIKVTGDKSITTNPSLNLGF